ncbi:MAG: hypothetical protein CL917_15325 [Deltaproteobacteria bacterium]|nr:hypothetical protein [Deltaproteobacteria bacterium]
MICHRNRMIFIHLPRTGGSSIEEALTGYDWWLADSQKKHLDWKQAKKIYASEWDHYLKFSVVRNPWSLVVSLYYSHSQLRARPKFLEKGPGRFRKWWPAKGWQEWLTAPRMADWEQDLFANKSPMADCIGPEVDVILRTESLQEDFDCMTEKHLGRKLSLPWSEKMGVSNRKHTEKHYSTYYNSEQAELIRSRFRHDLERFGYEFERL